MAITLFKKNTTKKKTVKASIFDRDKEQVMITATRDWLIMVAGIFVFLVAFSVMSVYFFFVVNDDMSLTEASQMMNADFLPQVVSEEDLMKVITTYNEREERLVNLLGDRPQFVDPSL